MKNTTGFVTYRYYDTITVRFEVDYTTDKIKIGWTVRSLDDTINKKLARSILDYRAENGYVVETVYVRGVPLKTHFEQASLFVEGQIPGSGVFPESALDVFDAEDASRLKYLYGLRHELTDVIDAVEGRLGVAVPYLNGAAADSIDGSLDYLDRSLDRTDRVYGVVMCVILVVFVIAMWLVV